MPTSNQSEFMYKKPLLKTEFQTVEFSDWENLVRTFLKEKDANTLKHFTEDNLVKGPLKTRSDRPETFSPITRDTRQDHDIYAWKISAPVEDSDLSFANIRALEDLEGGANALRISRSSPVNPSPTLWHFDKRDAAERREPLTKKRGITLRNGSDVKRLLSGIKSDLIPLTFAPRADISNLLKTIKTVPFLQSATINLGLNTLNPSEDLTDVIANSPESWRFLTVDGASFHNAGASPCLELAYMASKMVNFMRVLGPECAAHHMIFEISSDQDGHEMIAKIRALRIICARIKESFDLDDLSVEIHALTSRRMMQSLDPWTNFLRLNSAIFGAVCGGADLITSLPFTDPLGLPTEFGHRSARNLQLLLLEESQLGHVQDPAYGSYFHECLTQELAEKAWEKFQLIESAGGFTPYKQRGAFDSDLTQAIHARTQRQTPIVGVTLHPDTSARPVNFRPFSAEG